MTMKSALLIGFIVWAAAGAFLTVDGTGSGTDIRAANSFFSYADRTPLTP